MRFVSLCIDLEVDLDEEGYPERVNDLKKLLADCEELASKMNFSIYDQNLYDEDGSVIL